MPPEPCCTTRIAALWGLCLSFPSSAFVRLPGVGVAYQGQSPSQRPTLLLHGGGSDGSPAGEDGVAAINSKPLIAQPAGVGKREAHINWFMVTCQGSTRYWSYLEDYWPCAGGLSAVNAIGDGDADEEPFPIWRGRSAFEAGESDAPSAGVIVVDPFCDYLGKRCIDILEGAGYAVVQVMSEHLVSTTGLKGAEIFRPPTPGEEAAWAAGLPFPLMAVICESDAGLATAERLQAALLGPRFGGVNEARRDKYLMNEAVRKAGLASARQTKTGDWSKAREFLSTLLPPSPSSSSVPSLASPPENDGNPLPGGSKSKTGGNDEPTTSSPGDLEGRKGNVVATSDGRPDGEVASVVKPARGCASGSVFLCRGQGEARDAFYKILGTPKYGTPGAVNDEVVLQEFLVGTEWVVDTVSRDGDHKAMAIWRYDKRPVNGASFVYFSTQLMSSDGVDAQRVAEYAFQALDALGVKFGPTHTEVMMIDDDSGGTPTLIEVNTRWHLTDFAPLTDACVGYNAVEETLSAYLDPGRFDSLPRLPPAGPDSRHGRVVHLVSHVEGPLQRIHHEEEIRSMESFAGIDVYADPGRGGSGHMKKTIDIRSDAGWVRLVHDNKEVVERDYRRVVELMPTMYEVSAA